MSLIIKILGANCSKCNLLFDRVQNVVACNGIDAAVVKTEDLNEIAKYAVFVVPVLIIDEKIVSKGSLLSENQIIEKINPFLPTSQQIEVKVFKRPLKRNVFAITSAAVLFIASLVIFDLVTKNDNSSKSILKPLSMADSISKLYNYSNSDLVYRFTFLEFGSTHCVDCKKMEIVMEEARLKWPNKVNVVFYNVSEKSNKDIVEHYGIDMIPVQVLLNVNGIEYFRHQGFFPTDSLAKYFE